LRGVQRAAIGTTVRVASSLELGHAFQESLIPVSSPTGQRTVRTGVVKLQTVAFLDIVKVHIKG
jgi:hypothetical protein